MNKVVIIGASLAGHTVATALRDGNKDCPITLITEEAFTFYDRRMSFDYLEGKIKEKEILLSNPDFYQTKNINFLKERKAVSVNTAKRLVFLKNGEKRESIEYDFLVVCSGRKTFLPEIDGINKEGVFTFDSLKELKDAKNHLLGECVCVIGSNWLTVEFAKTVAARQKELKIITDKNIDMTLLPGNAEIINTQVVEIIGESGVQAVKFKEGKIIGASIVFVMGKSVPNVDFLKDTPVQMSVEAVLVDENMRSNISNIFSCGSVCCVKGGDFKLKSWDQTLAESRVLAENLIKTIGG
jgi:NAD(P)H-nitrite reductase large subunit